MLMVLAPKIISGTGIVSDEDMLSMVEDVEMGSLVHDIRKLDCVWDVVLVDGFEG